MSSTGRLQTACFWLLSRETRWHIAIREGIALIPANLGWALAGLGFGALAGLMLGTFSAFLYFGAWLLILLALPLLLLQFAFEGTIAGIAAIWRRWRGLPTEEPVEPEESFPRPLLWGFGVGIVVGALYGFANY